MRVFCGLLLLCLGIAISRDVSAEPMRPSENAAVIQSDNQFAVDLYAQLDREQRGKNLFFSPASVSLSLTMAAAGARGPTQAEMVKVLHLGEDLTQAHARNHRLLEQWNAVDQKRTYQLRVANRLWGQSGYPIRPEFLALTHQEYGAEMQSVDFAQAEAASRTINQWVEGQTNDKIKNVIPPGSLDALTRLVLTNAVYFKGDWAEPFDKWATQEEDFNVSLQQRVKTPMMHQEAKMGYAEEETFQALELPYTGRELSMVVLLPKKVDGLPELEKGLSVARLASLLSKLGDREVVICLPKFKLEAAFGLNPTLEAMGMKQAFSPKADFSGISSVEDLYISAVLHKAYLEVNETGTEAAAASALPEAKDVAKPKAEPLPVFRADHPFLFLIRDTKTGSILFMGRLTNPTK